MMLDPQNLLPATAFGFPFYFPLMLRTFLYLLLRIPRKVRYDHDRRITTAFQQRRISQY
jgi:hypothetical protein